MFLERSFYTVAVYVRRMKSTSNPPGVWKRILPFFWGSLHHCQLFWCKNQEKAGVSGWTTPWPSSGASLHYGQWAGAGDSHGKEHRGTRDESQGLLVQSQPKLVRKNVFFSQFGVSPARYHEIPPTWINSWMTEKLADYTRPTSWAIACKVANWTGQMAPLSCSRCLTLSWQQLFCCIYAASRRDTIRCRLQAQWPWLFLRMCSMKACLGSLRT